MKLINRNLSNLFVLALAIFVSLTSCNNAKKDMDNTGDEIEMKVEQIEQTADAKVKSTEKSYNNDNEIGVYNITQVDSPPLMSADCTTESSPKQCSDKKVMEFIKKNVNISKSWKNEGSFEQVLVIIEKDGSLRDIKYVASSNNDGCEACQKAAVDVVGKMSNWIPAKKDGKAVAVKMTIPVKFV